MNIQLLVNAVFDKKVAEIDKVRELTMVCQCKTEGGLTTVSYSDGKYMAQVIGADCGEPDGVRYIPVHDKANTTYWKTGNYPSPDLVFQLGDCTTAEVPLISLLLSDPVLSFYGVLSNHLTEQMEFKQFELLTNSWGCAVFDGCVGYKTTGDFSNRVQHFKSKYFPLNKFAREFTGRQNVKFINSKERLTIEGEDGLIKFRKTFMCYQIKNALKPALFVQQ